MRVCLTAGLLGSRRHLLADVTADAADVAERVCAVDDPPRDAWILDIEPNMWPGRDATTVLALAGVDIKFPPHQYVDAMRVLRASSAVPWASVIPRDVYADAVCGLLRDVVRALSGEDRSYYSDVFEPSRRLLKSLARSMIDVDRLRGHMTDAAVDVQLETFTPSHGFAQPIVYDQLGSRTGRLTVKSGPNILVLPRTMRDILCSRWPGGKIVALDFVSLEARLALLEAGHSDVPIDIYSDIAGRLLQGTPRDIVKRATLATLYGGGAGMLADIIDVSSAEWIIDALREHFNVKSVTTRLHHSVRMNGFIRNRFGRRVECADVAHLLYNSYIQSTGVDVALLGFTALVREIRARGLVSLPLFVLHDALVVDVHPDEVVNIEQLAGVGSQVKHYDDKFHIKLSKF